MRALTRADGRRRALELTDQTYLQAKPRDLKRHIKELLDVE